MFPRIIFCVFLTAGILAQDAKTAAPDTKGLQITGNVVDSVTGQPLSGTRVAIAPVSQRDAFTISITGGDGRFAFSHLTPGKYTLAAQRRGYLTQGFDQHGQFATSIVVGPDLGSTN